MVPMIIHGVFHLYHHIVLLESALTGPGLICPIMVSPAQAERKIRLSAFKHLIERTFQQLFSVAEPVMVIAETLYSCLACQLSLLLTGLRQTQVIESQIGRNPGLDMAAEQRLGLGYVCPFGESGSPPEVILRYGMELGKI